MVLQRRRANLDMARERNGRVERGDSLRFSESQECRRCRGARVLQVPRSGSSVDRASSYFTLMYDKEDKTAYRVVHCIE